MKNYHAFLVLFILFTNCQKDSLDQEYIEQILPHNTFLEVKKISLDEAQELDPVFEVFKKVENRSLNKKNNNISGIEIDGEEGSLVSDGTDNFYNFQIKRDKSSLIESLVIKVRYGAKEKQYASYITSYDLSLFDKVSLEKGENIDLALKMRIQPIVLDNVSS